MLTISTTYPSLDIQYFFPRAEIEQKVSEIKISSSGPSLQIDQIQSRNELGIGTYSYLSRKIREQGYQKVMGAIGQMAREGDAVLERSGRFQEEMIFADLAKRNSQAEIPELNIRAAPQTRPKIDFHYTQEISWDVGGAKIKHQVRPPVLTWQLGGVQVDVRG